MRRTLWVFVFLIGCVGRPCTPCADRTDQAPAPHAPTTGVVATVHDLATQAGLDAFARGGNAVDAAVAAALTLGVVDSHNSGIGGGCFILLRRADGTILALDGRETAPAAAHRDMFLRNGKAVPDLSLEGALAIGVPGSLAAYERVLAEAGRGTLADALRPAAELAERGFPLGRVLAARIASKRDALARFPASASVFLAADGTALAEGAVLRQPDLAATYRRLANEGTGWFYKGAFASRLDAWMQANGGLVTAADFAAYRVKARAPIYSMYRGHEIVGFPPPSSGGVHVAQILSMLTCFELQADPADDDPALPHHLLAEVMKRAFADRAHWLGDADFALVPKGLSELGYCAGLAREIDPNRATPVAGPGAPPNATEDVFGKHTTHLSAADEEGNWIAITTTINTAFGSKVMIPGTGVVMNNQMDDFAAQPGVPNAYGLIGAEANAVAPGKRPLSSMSPTIVLKDGEPVLALGGAGGPTIISQVVQTLIHMLDSGMSLEDAMAAPRIHHQWRPDLLYVEAGIPDAVRAGLERRGHRLKERPKIGVSQAVGRDAESRLVAVREPRLR
ncbi:MAG: gamma-glutamyltransferase [Planctomycetota bacterium]|nr:gamma-glutamyltransferase [Planctomycetota bacterium]